MPMLKSYEDRLYPVLEDIVRHFGTPFHIYDESGIRQTGQALVDAFSKLDSFKEYFAVKVLQNPSILTTMKDLGFGFDCSSIAELILSRQVGARSDDIMFSSNNTSADKFSAAAEDGGCILNLDDISLIPKVPEMPELICFRYNPGPRRSGNSIIGNPVESKYGVSHEQMVDACMSALMRPGIYGAYHHISVLGKGSKHNTHKVDVVGALCENNDKFAVQRLLPDIQDGDILCIHDTGAHGHAMGFNYNGRLQPKELLFRTDGSVELIRREETLDDYFATLNFEPQALIPEKLRS